MNKRKKQQGFTLLELMIVVALMGIMFSMSVKSFQKTRITTAIRSLSNDVTSVITQARIAAMTSGSDVTVCPAASAFPEPNIPNYAVALASTPALNTDCANWATLEAGSANKEMGWIIFKNSERNNTMELRTDLITRIPFDDRRGLIGVEMLNEAAGACPAGGCLSGITFNRKGMLVTRGATITVQANDATPDTHKGIGQDRQVVIAAITGRISNRLRSQ